MNIDSGNLTVVVDPSLPACSPTSLSDVQWIINQAHTLGLKVAYAPSTFAIFQGQANELEAFMLNPFPPPPPFPNIVTVFQNYLNWMTASAQVAAAAIQFR